MRFGEDVDSTHSKSLRGFELITSCIECFMASAVSCSACRASRAILLGMMFGGGAWLDQVKSPFPFWIQDYWQCFLGLSIGKIAIGSEHLIGSNSVCDVCMVLGVFRRIHLVVKQPLHHLLLPLLRPAWFQAVVLGAM
jgi:hypothetical protein